MTGPGAGYVDAGYLIAGVALAAYSLWVLRRGRRMARRLERPDQPGPAEPQ